MVKFSSGYNSSNQIELLEMLSERLERLNVDSTWARRASGTRGSVIKVLSQLKDGNEIDLNLVDDLVAKSMNILTQAAREIPDRKNE